jgi:DNA-binding phage protein
MNGKIKTRRWDRAEHLKTEEDMRLYFEACLEEAGDDPAFIAKALGVDCPRARHDGACPRNGAGP